MNPVTRLPSSVALAVVVACSCARSSSTSTSAIPVGISTVEQAVIIREPLAAWVNGPAKQAIVDFVTRVTAPGSPSLLPLDERIAVFDNDGTLWPEKPLPEAAFVVARLKAEVVEQSKLADREPYRSVLDQGVEGLAALGKPAVLAAFARTHSGMTDAQLEVEANRFFANAKHPRFNVPYTALVYRPMRELFAYLREHGFTIYLCTGGDEDFVRSFALRAYDIPRERVIGTSVRKDFVVENGQALLMRKAELLSLNDKEEKVVNIARRIGRRPVVAVGNVRTGGDVAMLTYARTRTGPALALVVNHDDAKREYDYHEPEGETLAAARERGFTVVSMKNDWTEVFDPTTPR
jgi:phosphoserine phosphatase